MITYSIINEEIKKFNKIAEKNNEIFNENKNEFKLIKQKFTQLSEFIRDVRFQNNINGQRRSVVFKREARNINFKKKQDIQKDYDENTKFGKSLFLESVGNENRLNESCDNIQKKEKQNNNSVFSTKKKNIHFSAINLNYKDISPNKVNDNTSVNNIEEDTQKKIREESNINLEICRSKKNIKNIKILNKANQNIITKEIELNILADSMNSVSSSSISDKNDEFYPNTERINLKNITLKNIIIKNTLNIDENKNKKIEGKTKNDEEIKTKEEIGKKLKLKSLELIAIESNKKINNIRKASENTEKNNDEKNEYSNLKYIRNYRNHKTDYDRLTDKNIFNDFDIINSEPNNQKETKLLLTELNQYNKKDDNENKNDNYNNDKHNNDNFNKDNYTIESEKKKPKINIEKTEENEYYEQSKTSRISSVVKRKISFNKKDDDNRHANKIFSNKKLDVFDNYINKNEENMNKILFKIVFLQNKYIPLIKKINDLFNMFKNLNSKVIENKISISQLQKNNKDEKCNTQNNDYKLFLSKTSRGRNNRYSLEIKHKKNKNYIKKMDNFDVSYKNKKPNDEANIILRRIEPFLIKEFKKKNI